MSLEQSLHRLRHGYPVRITSEANPDADRTIVDEVDFRSLNPLDGGQGLPQFVFHPALRCCRRHRR
jgi:hypothetical protein